MDRLFDTALIGRAVLWAMDRLFDTALIGRVVLWVDAVCLDAQSHDLQTFALKMCTFL